MKPQLTDIRGIGPSAARNLAENGIQTVERLAKSRAGEVAIVRGFSEMRANSVITAAVALLAAADPSQTAAEKDEPARPAKKGKSTKQKTKKSKSKEDKKKKDKKDKKDKRKKNKKKRKKDKSDKKGKKDKKKKKRSSEKKRNKK